MSKQMSIIEMEAKISALEKQLKNIATNSNKKEEKFNCEITKLHSEIKELKNENKYLYELLKLSKKKMFGKSGEQIAQSYGQISLFNEAESELTVLTYIYSLFVFYNTNLCRNKLYFFSCFIL